MIIDALNQFADAVALNTGGAADYNIGDAIDLSVARNIGAGIGAGQLWLVILVDTTATSGGSATGAFSLITDDNSSFSSATVIYATGAIAVASMVAGTMLLCIPLPPSDSYERYIGLRQTTAVAAFTAGKITAFLTNTPPLRRAYPDAL